jgi:hypothetical protein
MHTILVIGGGIVLLGLCLLFGHLWGSGATSLSLAAKVFLPLWLAVSSANLWVGVERFGYSLREELPILIVIFSVPAVSAGLLIWYLSR